MLVQIDTLVDSIFNIVRLSSDWVAESFVGQNDIFEKFLCYFFIFFGSMLLEVRMMLFGHFVVG